MLNKNLLLSKVVLYGDAQKDLADLLGLSVQRVNAKLNGTDGAEFRQSEIAKIIKRYNLTAEEVMLIFFSQNVSCLGTM